MIEIENLEQHLNQITKEEWNELFNLIPKIARTIDFGNNNYGAEIVSNTLNHIYNLNLPPVFNWVDWDFGKEILTSNNFDYTVLDKLTLCKLLTCIIRTNRFNEGYILKCFKDRTFEKILFNLKKEIKKAELKGNNLFNLM